MMMDPRAQALQRALGGMPQGEDPMAGGPEMDPSMPQEDKYSAVETAMAALEQFSDDPKIAAALQTLQECLGGPSEMSEDTDPMSEDSEFPAV